MDRFMYAYRTPLYQKRTHNLCSVNFKTLIFNYLIYGMIITVEIL